MATNNHPHYRNKSKSKSKKSRKECTTYWLTALDDATAILRQQQHSSNIKVYDKSFQYLERCQDMLQKLERYWDDPPLKDPPRYYSNSRKDQDRINVIGGLHPQQQQESVPPMPMRRILIRILTAQSEILNLKVIHCLKNECMQGAETYEQSLEKIHAALNLVDTEYARLIMAEEEDTEISYLNGPSRFNNDMKFQNLEEDGSIVAVSVEQLTRDQDKYRRWAEYACNRLRRRLEPQWSSRDDVRQRIGEQRWMNNPSPKNDYAHLRKQDEQALRLIEKAIQQLDELKVSIPQINTTCYNRKQAQRYNGLRPTDLSRRVPLELYPDPTLYEWKFTGSWNDYVEFFERADGENDIVKLDWYFTTATIKTSMHHPSQGKTQLFGAKVTPEIYIAILQNPREHTNVRYQTRDAQPNHNV